MLKSTYNFMPTPKELHHQAEEIREQGKFNEALEIYAKVIKGYYANKNYLGIVEALGGQSLTYKNLFLVDPQPKYLELSAGSAQASLELALKYNLSNILFRCYFSLAEVNMLSKDYKEAAINFKKSYDLTPGTSVEKCRALSHWAEARYFSGDTDNVESDLKESLNILNKYQDQVYDYTKNVWESGILMKLLVLTKDKKYLAQAQAIIDSDSRLTIRKRQLDELKSSL